MVLQPLCNGYGLGGQAWMSALSGVEKVFRGVLLVKLPLLMR